MVLPTCFFQALSEEIDASKPLAVAFAQDDDDFDKIVSRYRHLGEIVRSRDHIGITTGTGFVVWFQIEIDHQNGPSRNSALEYRILAPPDGLGFEMDLNARLCRYVEDPGNVRGNIARFVVDRDVKARRWL